MNCIDLNGMNRRDLDLIFIYLGGTVEYVRRTGEVRYRHPLFPDCPRANARNKHASRHLSNFVRRVIREIRRRKVN